MLVYEEVIVSNEKTFTLRSDARALIYLKMFKDSNSKLHRKAMAMERFNFRIIHMSASRSNAMAVADFLSRSYDCPPTDKVTYKHLRHPALEDLSVPEELKGRPISRDEFDKVAAVYGAKFIEDHKILDKEIRRDVARCALILEDMELEERINPVRLQKNEPNGKLDEIQGLLNQGVTMLDAVRMVDIAHSRGTVQESDFEEDKEIKGKSGHLICENTGFFTPGELGNPEAEINQTERLLTTIAENRNIIEQEVVDADYEQLDPYLTPRIVCINPILGIDPEFDAKFGMKISQDRVANTFAYSPRTTAVSTVGCESSLDCSPSIDSCVKGNLDVTQQKVATGSQSVRKNKRVTISGDSQAVDAKQCLSIRNRSVANHEHQAVNDEFYLDERGHRDPRINDSFMFSDEFREFPEIVRMPCKNPESNDLTKNVSTTQDLDTPYTSQREYDPLIGGAYLHNEERDSMDELVKNFRQTSNNQLSSQALKRGCKTISADQEMEMDYESRNLYNNIRLLSLIDDIGRAQPAPGKEAPVTREPMSDLLAKSTGNVISEAEAQELFYDRSGIGRILLTTAKNAMMSPEALSAAQMEEEPYQKRMEALKLTRANTRIDGHFLKRGVLMKDPRNPDDGTQPRVCVPMSLVPLLLRRYHGIDTGIHVGSSKMAQSLRMSYDWKHLTDDVKAFCRKCQICQYTRVLKRPNAPLVRKQGPVRPNDCIAIDIVGPLPLSVDRKQYLLVMMDEFSKFCIVSALRTKEAQPIARAFMESWIQRFGVPVSIRSDRGLDTHSLILQELAMAIGSKKITTAAYNPEANAYVERINGTLKEMLRSKLFERDLNIWSLVIPFLVMAYNHVPHSATKIAPIKLMTGQDVSNHMMPLMFEDHPIASGNKYAAATLRAQQLYCAMAREGIEQERKSRVDKQGRKLTRIYRIGDLVLVKIFQQRAALVAGGRGKSKLLSQYDGPYRVISVASNQLKVVKLLNAEEAEKANKDKVPLHNQPRYYEAPQARVVHPRACRPYYDDRESDIKKDDELLVRRFLKSLGVIEGEAEGEREGENKTESDNETNSLINSPLVSSRSESVSRVSSVSSEQNAEEGGQEDVADVPALQPLLPEQAPVLVPPAQQEAVPVHGGVMPEAPDVPPLVHGDHDGQVPPNEVEPNEALPVGQGAMRLQLQEEATSGEEERESDWEEIESDDAEWLVDAARLPVRISPTGLGRLPDAQVQRAPGIPVDAESIRTYAGDERRLEQQGNLPHTRRKMSVSDVEKEARLDAAREERFETPDRVAELHLSQTLQPSISMPRRGVQPPQDVPASRSDAVQPAVPAHDVELVGEVPTLRPHLRMQGRDGRHEMDSHDNYQSKGAPGDVLRNQGRISDSASGVLILPGPGGNLSATRSSPQSPRDGSHDVVGTSGHDHLQHRASAIGTEGVTTHPLHSARSGHLRREFDGHDGDGRTAGGESHLARTAHTDSGRSQPSNRSDSKDISRGILRGDGQGELCPPAPDTYRGRPPSIRDGGQLGTAKVSEDPRRLPDARAELGGQPRVPGGLPFELDSLQFDGRDRSRFPLSEDTRPTFGESELQGVDPLFGGRHRRGDSTANLGQDPAGQGTRDNVQQVRPDVLQQLSVEGSQQVTETRARVEVDTSKAGEVDVVHHGGRGRRKTQEAEAQEHEGNDDLAPSSRRPSREASDVGATPVHDRGRGRSVQHHDKGGGHAQGHADRYREDHEEQTQAALGSDQTHAQAVRDLQPTSAFVPTSTRQDGRRRESGVARTPGREPSTQGVSGDPGGSPAGPQSRGSQLQPVTPISRSSLDPTAIDRSRRTLSSSPTDPFMTPRSRLHVGEVYEAELGREGHEAALGREGLEAELGMEDEDMLSSSDEHQKTLHGHDDQEMSNDGIELGSPRIQDPDIQIHHGTDVGYGESTVRTTPELPSSDVRGHPEMIQRFRESLAQHGPWSENPPSVEDEPEDVLEAARVTDATPKESPPQVPVHHTPRQLDMPLHVSTPKAKLGREDTPITMASGEDLSQPTPVAGGAIPKTKVRRTLNYSPDLKTVPEKVDESLKETEKVSVHERSSLSDLPIKSD